MGIKRPLEEDILEQLDYNKKLICNTEESHMPIPRVDSPGGPKSNFFELQFDGRLEYGETDGAFVAEKELEALAPLSLVTSSSSEEDAGNGDTSFWSYFPGYINISIPRRPPKQYEDPYISLLNSSPRKEVPIGPDYQAEIPPWEGPNYFTGDREQEFMGTCIIPMPDFNDSTTHGVGVGRGRTDCCCLDVGSMRCVQQHVKEAREKLLETIGEKTFAGLGFYDMGEEVACKWTPEDEHLFHEIVFSNPASHGRNFWKHLKLAFPTRTMRELVSYYFNVFMLRRRAVQNRSYLLEIDSDDDEERTGAHGGDFYRGGSHSLDQDTGNDDDQKGGKCCIVREEDEDSTVESFGDQDDTSWMDDFWSEPEKPVKDEVSNRNHGTSHEQDAVEFDGKTENGWAKEEVA